MQPWAPRNRNSTDNTHPNTNKMKKIEGYIETGMVGSRREFEFEMEDGATPQEIEEAAKEAAFNLIEWNYTVNGESPQ